MVFVNMEKRRKRLKFPVEAKVFPASVISALNEASKTDPGIATFLKEKFIVLQKKDGNNQLFDLEDDDEIFDEEDVFVVAMTLVQEIVVPVPVTAVAQAQEVSD